METVTRMSQAGAIQPSLAKAKRKPLAEDKRKSMYIGIGTVVVIIIIVIVLKALGVF